MPTRSESDSLSPPLPINPSDRKYVLKSSDGEEFVVDESVLVQSLTLKSLVDNEFVTLGSLPIIPLPKLTAKVLAKVLEYCKRHAAAAPPPGENGAAVEAVDEELKAFDAEFINVEHDMLFNIILAANYLHITNLLDLSCQAVADMIKGKSPEEIRTTFNIENDFSPEEEAAVRRENAWAFES